MAINLTNKIAVVTGGTRGIGRASAELLVTAGARVAISARHEDAIPPSNTSSTFALRQYTVLKHAVSG